MVQTCNTGYSKLENECARAPHGILPQGPPPINTQPPRYECRPGLSTWPQCSHGGRPPSSTDLLKQSPKRVEVPCHGWNCVALSVPKDLRLPPPPPGMMR